MPNYCQNQATFTHADKKQVDALFDEFKKLIDTDGKDGRPFQLLHPIPEEQENNWYEWRIANWGTKWDAMAAWDLERENDNTFSVSFHTAWAPPLDWYEAIEGNDWEVDAVYFEAGIGAAGSYSEGCKDTMEVTTTLYRILNARFNTAA
jgi:hypothetical protein